MKRTITILLLLTLIKTSAQYGVEGAIYAALMTGITVPEMNQLKKISKAQDELVTYSAIIAIETTAIVEIEEKILEAETEVRPIIQDLQTTLGLARTSENIVRIQDRIVALVSNTPELIPLAAQSQYHILRDAAYIMNDVLVATRESETNLLDNKDRIDILNSTQEGLALLETKSLKLLTFLEGAVATDFGDVPDVLFDYSSAIEEQLEETENVINEN